MKKPFKKAVHWGPDVVNIIEQTVLKSSTESLNNGVYRQRSRVPWMNFFPRSGCRLCKKKHSAGIAPGHRSGKPFHCDKKPAKNKCSMKTTKGKSVRNCICFKGAGPEDVRVHCSEGKRKSSAVQEIKRKNKSRKCRQVTSKDKLAKVCKNSNGPKPNGMPQKVKRSGKQRAIGTGPRESAQLFKIKGHGNTSCPFSNMLKLQRSGKSRKCHCCRRN